jgi:Tfp pilus assembly protein PilV
MIEVLIAAVLFFVLFVLGVIAATVHDNRYARRRRLDRQVNRID